MPITGPIPLPESGMDDFLKQLQQGTQNRQKDREQTETERYHKRSLDIHQQASDRAQALLPSMIQQYQDTHEGKITQNAKDHLEFKITKQFYDEAMKENKPSQPATQQQAPQQMPQPQESLPQPDQAPRPQLAQPGSQIPGTPSLADVMQNFMGGGLPQRSPMQGMEQQVQQSVSNPDLNMQNSPLFKPQNQPMQPQEQQPQTAGNAPQSLPSGEKEISPGNPNLYFADKMAGHVKSIPAPQVHFGKDGMIYMRYPSGRITVANAGGGAGSENAGMSPEEVKEKNREKLAEYKDTLTEKKEDRKEARDLRTKAAPVEGILHSIDEIRAIYDRNKKLTGPGAAFGKRLGMIDKKDLGALTAAFGKLQADIAHNSSKQGGAQVIRWAGTVKPSVFNPTNFNLGMIDNLENAALYDYSTMNRDHKGLINKDLPAYNDKIKQFENGNAGQVKTITIIDSNGKEHEIDDKNFDEAKKRDQGVRKK